MVCRKKMKKFLFSRRKILIKRNIISLLALCILLLSFISLVAAPEISFDALTHDFGDIKEEDGKVTHDFNFENTGDDTLKIIRVKAS